MRKMQGEHQIRGGDQLGLRAYNKRMILNLIRQHGALPKAEIPPMSPVLDTSKRSADEQAEIRAKRAAVKAAKKEAERARKAQAAAARRK